MCIRDSDCGISEHTVKLLEESYASGDLKLKIFALLTDSLQYHDRWVKKGRYVNGSLTVGGFKAVSYTHLDVYKRQK